ncbi:hypothetical protein [Actinacidiphila sp. bgisy167]|uniref:hypothetical protein n=1 Tax=Actinacidiphila sp. bgisy167 TaxID=3413797 RepID=UPI003D72ED81
MPGGCLVAIALGSLPAGEGLSAAARPRVAVALALTGPRSPARRVIAGRRPAVRASAEV